MSYCKCAASGAIACTTAAVLLPQDLTVCIFGTTVDHKYLWLCFALALWGLGQGAGPVVEALLADSTRTGWLASKICRKDCMLLTLHVHAHQSVVSIAATC